ncbi:MAG TPA: hypothetical protein VJB65_03555 [Patescibacteria group bacterium]|nr:hypothetical protein [Patescibacteria group bacterium]
MSRELRPRYAAGMLPQETHEAPLKKFSKEQAAAYAKKQAAAEQELANQFLGVEDVEESNIQEAA